MSESAASGAGVPGAIFDEGAASTGAAIVLSGCDASTAGSGVDVAVCAGVVAAGRVATLGGGVARDAARDAGRDGDLWVVLRCGAVLFACGIGWMTGRETVVTPAGGVLSAVPAGAARLSGVTISRGRVAIGASLSIGP